MNDFIGADADVVLSSLVISWDDGTIPIGSLRVGRCRNGSNVLCPDVAPVVFVLIFIFTLTERAEAEPDLNLPAGSDVTLMFVRPASGTE